MEILEVDPFSFITTECLIPTAQHDLLSTTLFYREEDFSPAADHAADYGFDDTWPVSSDDDEGENGVPLPDYNAVEIIFCSVPSTPDNQDDVVPSRSDELGFCAEKLNDVVSGNSNKFEGLCVEGESFDLNDVVCGSSDELGVSVEGKKSRFSEGEISAAGNKESDFNDVVCGDSDQLGFSVEGEKSRFSEGEISAAENRESDLNDVVFGDCDELGFSVERKRAREESSVTPLRTKRKLRFCDDAENTTVVSNDVAFENTEEVPNNVVCENTEEIVNDVVCESTDDLGLRFCDVENTEEVVNDVVRDDSDELGFRTEERGESPAEGITNDVVSGNSIDLGFQGEGNMTNEVFVSPTTTENALDDVVYVNSVDLGERDVMNEEFMMRSPSITTELSYPELDGAEMAVECENTAKVDYTEEVTVVDDEEVMENDANLDNTEEVTVVDDEDVMEHDANLNHTEEINKSCDNGGDDDSNVDSDTEVVAEEEEEEELNDSTLERNSKAETCGNHVKCLMEVLKMLAEKTGKEKENGEVDFLETAKSLGYTFPKPRWMSS